MSWEKWRLARKLACGASIWRKKSVMGWKNRNFPCSGTIWIRIRTVNSGAEYRRDAAEFAPVVAGAQSWKNSGNSSWAGGSASRTRIRSSSRAISWACHALEVSGVSPVGCHSCESKSGDQCGTVSWNWAGSESSGLHQHHSSMVRMGSIVSTSNGGSGGGGMARRPSQRPWRRRKNV